MKTITLQPFLRFQLIFLMLMCDIFLHGTIECQPLTFDLKTLPRESKIKLSEIGATEIQYIPLETIPQSLISLMRRIIFSRSYFITLGYGDIKMFRYDGSFVIKIGTNGRGPNEFITAHDVDINPKDESIYVADGWQQKFLVFNKNGEIRRTFKCPVRGPLNFRFTDDGILCYYQNHMGITENSFILMDTTGKIIKNFSNKYPWKRTVPNVAYPEENIFYKYNGNLIKKEIYSDTVFTYKNKGFEPHLIIDVGKLRLTPAKREQYDARYLLNTFLTPANLFEFGNCIYYEFIIPNNGKKVAYIGSKNRGLSLLLDTEIGLINDIDGGPNIWPKAVKDNSTIITWIEALKLKQYVTSNELKTLKTNYPEKKKEFEKLALSLKETDNPVLIMIKTK